MSSQTLQKRRILLVEDNVPLATFLEKILRDAGAEVLGPVATVSNGRKLIAESNNLSAALLDVRLHGGEEVWPIALLLANKRIPFVFYTANADTLPDEWIGRPTITKPSRPSTVIRALADVISVPMKLDKRPDGSGALEDGHNQP